MYDESIFLFIEMGIWWLVGKKGLFEMEKLIDISGF